MAVSRRSDGGARELGELEEIRPRREDNLGGHRISLDDDELGRIEEATAPRTRYLQWTIEFQTRRESR